MGTSFSSFTERPTQKHMLQKYQKKNSLLKFREVVRQLDGLEEYGEPLCYKHAPKDKPDLQADHMPVFSDSRHTCRVCYDIEKTQRKVFHIVMPLNVRFICSVQSKETASKSGIKKTILIGSKCTS